MHLYDSWDVILVVVIEMLKMLEFFFFDTVPEILSPKHHKILEFGENDHISAMKVFDITAGLLQ
jgi:hypothetical protein